MHEHKWLYVGIRKYIKNGKKKGCFVLSYVYGYITYV